MSTHDVPGAKAANNDELAMGCWAEAGDGSLILVESTEQGRVIFLLFDLTRDPIIEYRDAMPDDEFKREFSWGGSQRTPAIRWTWHDKTAFPWDRLIQHGSRPGPRHVSADDQLSAAARVAESLRARGRAVRDGDYSHMAAQIAHSVSDAIRDAFDRHFGDRDNDQ